MKFVTVYTIYLLEKSTWKYLKCLTYICECLWLVKFNSVNVPMTQASFVFIFQGIEVYGPATKQMSINVHTKIAFA